MYCTNWHQRLLEFKSSSCAVGGEECPSQWILHPALDKAWTNNEIVICAYHCAYLIVYAIASNSGWWWSVKAFLKKSDNTFYRLLHLLLAMRREHLLAHLQPQTGRWKPGLEWLRSDQSGGFFSVPCVDGINLGCRLTKTSAVLISLRLDRGGVLMLRLCLHRTWPSARNGQVLHSKQYHRSPGWCWGCPHHPVTTI